MPLTKPSSFTIACVVDRRAPFIALRAPRAANNLLTDEFRAAPDNGNGHLAYFLNPAWIR
jgi:hypothetical protein